MSHAGHGSFFTRIDNISISAVSDEEVSEIIESCRREERPALHDVIADQCYEHCVLDL
jgi:hypothetical protein